MMTQSEAWLYIAGEFDAYANGELEHVFTFNPDTVIFTRSYLVPYGMCHAIQVLWLRGDIELETRNLMHNYINLQRDSVEAFRGRSYFYPTVDNKHAGDRASFCYAAARACD
jgi:hypothetical protein